MSIEELTVKLHEELGRTLLEQIQEGGASSGVLAAAIKWLKDQNMVINMTSENLPSTSDGPSLVEDLPFHDEVFKAEDAVIDLTPKITFRKDAQ